MYRDFTYIDDIVESVYKISRKIPKSSINSKNRKPNNSFTPFKILNIGSNRPINLNSY